MSCRWFVALASAVTLWAACSGDEEDEPCDVTRFSIRLEGAMASAIAEEHYNADPTWTTTRMVEVTAAAAAQQGKQIDDLDFFVDTASGDRRPIKAVDDMSDDELAAYNAWLNSGLVLEATGETQAEALESVEPHLDQLADRYCD